MATLPTCFSAALTAIEPDEDKKNAVKAYAEVAKVLRNADSLKALGIDPVLIGSYGRQVSIKRIKDVDVFGRLTLAGDSLGPGKASGLFEKVLEVAFPGRVDRQPRSFKIRFPEFGLTVDVVPARPYGDHWEIPNRPNERARWVETNPTKLNELTTEANRDFTLNDRGIYVPTVKLVRQVRRAFLGASHPGGFFFEILTYWAFQTVWPSESSHAHYLTAILEEIAGQLPAVAADGLSDPTLAGKTITTRATSSDLSNAAKKMSEAASLARAALDATDECRAAERWVRLLGKDSTGEQVFPTPTYCKADGTRRTSARTTPVGIVAGAATVPAGSDRFA